MYERIKMLRKSLGLTQQEFADKIGVKRGAIANYEIGRNDPTDSVVSLICREFYCSEQWLRTGEGDMFPPRNKNEQIVDFMTGLMKQPDNSAAKCFIESISHLTPDEWSLLSKIAADWAAAMNSENEESRG